jgi:hypothetical protein
MSREAKYIISRLLEIDTRRRIRAGELMREAWIKCSDIPLSIFETAGSLFRASSVDGRAIMSLSTVDHENRSKAEGFNKSLAKLHVKALDNLKGMGISSKAVDESLRYPQIDGAKG